MIDPITTARIFSTLGNNSSLIPLGIKDISNIAGMTAGSYVTGNSIEGKDRFIDEMGTSVIWLLGVPFFNKVIDKTAYKAAKFNPKVDARILQDQNVLKKAIEHAPTKEIKESIEHAAKNQKAFKGLGLAKFIASTAMTLFSYFALTTFRHKHTEKNIIKEIKKEQELKKVQDELAEQNDSTAFKSFGNKQTGKDPSFGMNLSALQQFMFDPVKNTMVIDGGITTQRLSESRNPQDFMGYVIKEGGFLTFMYLLGPAIQKYLEKKAAKSNKPIDLDIRVLQDEKLQKAIKDKSIQKHLAGFPTKGTDAEIYESLFKKGDNLVVQMAKKSEIIKTMKVDGKEVIDTQEYIDIKKLKGIKEKLETLKNSASLKENTDEFFKHVLKLKRASIVKNIGFSIGALGVIVPGIMVAMRFLKKDNQEFAVKKEIHEKLKQQNLLA